MTDLDGKWDPLVDFHLFQLNVTNFVSSASYKLSSLENYCMLDFFGLEKSCKVFLKDLISIQPGMRQGYGRHPNTKVILGKFVQTNHVFRKGKG